MPGGELAAAPFIPATAPRLPEQLGLAYAYEPDGNGGPPILLELLNWAAMADAGRGTARAAVPAVGDRGDRDPAEA